MASLLTVSRLFFKNVLSAAPHAAASTLWRHVTRYLLSLAAILLFSLNDSTVWASDMARDTPAASMALAVGLYAAPAPSTSVSTVTTPTITASPLPSEAPPQTVSAAAPAVIAMSPPPSTATEAAWINYVALFASIVGAIAGIAGAIMGGVSLRRTSRQGRRY
jgi:hypothetical protein